MINIDSKERIEFTTNNKVERLLIAFAYANVVGQLEDSLYSLGNDNDLTMLHKTILNKLVKQLGYTFGSNISTDTRIYTLVSFLENMYDNSSDIGNQDIDKLVNWKFNKKADIFKVVVDDIIRLYVKNKTIDSFLGIDNLGIIVGLKKYKPISTNIKHRHHNLKQKPAIDSDVTFI